jgi:hypothetical protein
MRPQARGQVGLGGWAIERKILLRQPQKAGYDPGMLFAPRQEITYESVHSALLDTCEISDILTGVVPDRVEKPCMEGCGQ